MRTKVSSSGSISAVVGFQLLLPHISAGFVRYPSYPAVFLAVIWLSREGPSLCQAGLGALRPWSKERACSGRKQ